MKKLFFLASLALSLVVVIPQTLAAPNIGLGPDGLAGKTAQQAGYDPSTSDTAFAETVGKIIKAILSLAGIMQVRAMIPQVKNFMALMMRKNLSRLMRKK